MNIILKGRRQGKTTDLIKQASNSGGYIVCANEYNCAEINNYAIKIGIKIPYPITYSEFINGQFYSKGITEFLIDDADLLLMQLAKGVTISHIALSEGRK